MATLAENTFGMFNQAGANAGQMYNSGLGMLGQGAAGFGQMMGMMPSDVQAGSLNGMNLSGYMNPFQQNVIDASMGELNRQELMQSNQMKDEAQRANAFGGDRMGVQMAENNRNFDMTRANTLANLNSQNFTNAQSMATNDLNRSMQGQQANQSMRAGMMQNGASGLAQLGQNQSQFGQGQLGGLSNQGFNMGQQINQNQMQVGNQQQQLQQQILNNIMGQTNAWQNYGDTGLQRYFGATQNPGGYGTSTTNGSVTSSTNPGAMGIIGGIGSILGAFI